MKYYKPSLINLLSDVNFYSASPLILFILRTRIKNISDLTTSISESTEKSINLNPIADDSKQTHFGKLYEVGFTTKL